MKPSKFFGSAREASPHGLRLMTGCSVEKGWASVGLNKGWSSKARSKSTSLSSPTKLNPTRTYEKNSTVLMNFVVQNEVAEEGRSCTGTPANLPQCRIVTSMIHRLDI
jgi:hypothetical protein